MNDINYEDWDRLIWQPIEDNYSIILEDFRRKLEGVPEGPLQELPKQQTLIFPLFELVRDVNDERVKKTLNVI